MLKKSRTLIMFIIAIILLSCGLINKFSAPSQNPTAQAAIQSQANRLASRTFSLVTKPNQSASSAGLSQKPISNANLNEMLAGKYLNQITEITGTVMTAYMDHGLMVIQIKPSTENDNMIVVAYMEDKPSIEIKNKDKVLVKGVFKGKLPKADRFGTKEALGVLGKSVQIVP